MTPNDVFARLVSQFGEDAVFEFHGDLKKDKDPWFQCGAARIVEIATFLRDEDELAFDFMECMTGTDWPAKQQIQVTIHLYSYVHKHRIVLKLFLDRDAPKMPTLSAVWPVANWQERECFDLLGVVFDGHPDLRRILLPDDWIGHPLRKDFVEANDYHGIPTTRPNPLDLLKPPLVKIGIPAKEPAKA